MKDDMISRQAALNALGERPVVWSDNDDYTLGERNQYDMDRLAIETVPSAQLAQDLPKGCTDTISRQAAIDALEKVADMFPWRVPGNRDTYDRYNEAWNDAIGRAEMEIENMPSAQPGEDIRAMCGECDAWNQYKNYTLPRWIPCSTALPEYDGEYLVTKKSFGWNCKEYIETDIARYEKKDGWHKADTVLAWCELPTPYREGGQDGKN